MTSRRKLLQQTLGGALLTGIAPLAVFAGNSQPERRPESPGYRRLAALLGSDFIVIEENGRLSQLLLSEIETLSVTPHLEQFHLYLENTGSNRLSEQTYPMHHARLGDQLIYLQPMDFAVAGPDYRASYSLLMSD